MTTFDPAELEQRRADLATIADLQQNAGSVLTNWETDFLKSINARLNSYKLLSEKQRAVLQKIKSQASERLEN